MASSSQREIYRKNHLKRRHDLDWELFDELCQFYGDKCLCCERPGDWLTLTPDHILPKSEGGSLGIENIQPLCKRCNDKKVGYVDYRSDKGKGFISYISGDFLEIPYQYQLPLRGFEPLKPKVRDQPFVDRQIMRIQKGCSHSTIREVLWLLYKYEPDYFYYLVPMMSRELRQIQEVNQ